MSKWVYTFGGGSAEGDASMKNLLGGKGANLAEMSNLGLPVPPGFTITTEVCTHHTAHDGAYPADLKSEVEVALKRVGELAGGTFGDAARPLLVSVRSGARASMPGMMDTVLNLGLNAQTAEGLAALTGNPRFAYDSYRRFVQMYSNVVLGVEHGLFEEILDGEKEEKGVELDTDLDAEDLKRIAGLFKNRVAKELGKPFPEDVHEQLWGAIGAVFGSWQSARAKTYRKLHNIAQDWGTAVNVQAMVFGNRGTTSATGVAFTRDPATGEHILFGEFLINAQGEDVVAGIRTPQPITRLVRERQGGRKPSMEEAMPQTYAELMRIGERLEKHYRDMQDVEFTVQEGKLFMLQTRSGKRTAEAALKAAVDMVGEGLIGREDAVARVDPMALDQLLHPTLDPNAAKELIATGLGASPGAATGEVAFTAEEAEKLAGDGRDVIPGAHRDEPGGHPRHACGARHPHRARRHDEPRRRRRARHGPTLRLGRGHAQDRRRRWHDDGGAGDDQARRDRHHRRHDGRGLQGPRRDAPARAHRRFRDADGLGRFHPYTEGSRQRRYRDRRHRGAALRGRRHRALPHRAHVLRAGPDPRRAPDDPGRRKDGTRRGARQAAFRCSAAISRRSSGRWKACRSPSACSTRRCTNSCRRRTRRSPKWRGRRARRRRSCAPG